MRTVYNSIAPTERGRLERFADLVSRERSRLRNQYLDTHPGQKIPSHLQGEFFRNAMARGLAGVKDDYTETCRKIGAILSSRKVLGRKKSDTEKMPTIPALAQEARTILAQVGNDPHRAVEAVIAEHDLDGNTYGEVIEELVGVKERTTSPAGKERKSLIMSSASRFLDFPLVGSENPQMTLGL